MSSGFEGVTPGPWTVMDETTVLSADPNVAICDAFPADKSGDEYRYGESSNANARLIAEAGTVLHETGLTPRQLAEQRAELLEVLRSTRGVLACALRLAAPDFFESDEDVSDHIQIKKIDAAIANATQQRNATGGEG